MSWSNFTCTRRVVESRLEAMKVGLDVLARCFRMLVVRVVADSRVGVWDVSRNMRARLRGDVLGNMLLEKPDHRLFHGNVDSKFLILEFKFVDGLFVLIEHLTKLGGSGLKLDYCSIFLGDDGGLLEHHTCCIKDLCFVIQGYALCLAVGKFPPAGRSVFWIPEVCVLGRVIRPALTGALDSFTGDRGNWSFSGFGTRRSCTACKQLH